MAGLIASIFKVEKSDAERCLEVVCKEYGISKNEAIQIVLKNQKTGLANLPVEIKEMIMLELDYESLRVFCQVSREIRDLCEDQRFWKKKLQYDYGPSALKNVEHENYKKAYLSIRKIYFSLIIRAEDPAFGSLPARVFSISQNVSKKFSQERFQRLALNFLKERKWLTVDVEVPREERLTKENIRDIFERKDFGMFYEDDDTYVFLSRELPEYLLGKEVYVLLLLDVIVEETWSIVWNFQVFETLGDMHEWISKGHLVSFLPELSPGINVEYDPLQAIKASREYLSRDLSDEDILEIIQEGLPFYSDPYRILPEDTETIGTKTLAEIVTQGNFFIDKGDASYISLRIFKTTVKTKKLMPRFLVKK